MIPDNNLKKCFTIGYGDYPIDLFFYFLQKTGIDTIVDVRTSPYSSYNYSFNRDNLEKFLNTHQISYLYMGDKMGGGAQSQPSFTGWHRKLPESPEYREISGRSQPGSPHYCKREKDCPDVCRKERKNAIALRLFRGRFSQRGSGLFIFARRSR